MCVEPVVPSRTDVSSGGVELHAAGAPSRTVAVVARLGRTGHGVSISQLEIGALEKPGSVPKNRGAHALRVVRQGTPESTMRKNRQMAESQLEDGLQVVVVNAGDIFSQVPEKGRHFDPRSDGQKRGSGPREFPMHARGPPAAFRPTFLGGNLMVAEEEKKPGSLEAKFAALTPEQQLAALSGKPFKKKKKGDSGEDSKKNSYDKKGALDTSNSYLPLRHMQDSTFLKLYSGRGGVG